MNLLILVIIVLVVLALALYLIDLLPIENSTIKRVIQALCVLVALIFILDRAGIYRSGLVTQSSNIPSQVAQAGQLPLRG